MSIKFKIKAKIMQLLMEQKKKERFDIETLDQRQLPENVGPHINNSYYFGGNNLAGESLILRVGYRNTGKIEIFVIYSTESGDFYAIEKQEYPTEESPIQFKCVEPGKVWNIQFDGNMVDTKSQKVCHCTFDVNFTATLEAFSALHHSDFRGMAEAFAREKWNKKFFKGLTGDTGVGKEKEKDKAKLSQIHYEQTGLFEGTLTLDGEVRPIHLTAARDHSFGKRDWNVMSNHVWLLPMTDKGEVLNVSLVNFDHVKQVFCGYSNYGLEKNTAMTGYKIISYEDNDGMGPDDMEIECYFANGETLNIKAHRDYNILTPFDNGNYYFQEALGTFEVNGVKSRGTIEYGFNKNQSRWSTYVIEK